jgi:16S rRNA (adenine1518-N6/adenine1519-N6)-dimethyltransferase
LPDAEAIERLPPLRDVIAAHNLWARKALGQNFLFDLNLTRRIARAGGPLQGAHIIEIGAGPGGLTRSLLLEGAALVTAIERDRRALSALAQVAAAAPGRLTLIEADALAVDYPGVGRGLPMRVVANLPYNIATKLLLNWLATEMWPPWWSSLTLMFQREVAERIVAAPGTKAYGRLSVLAEWRATARILFEVQPRAFTPPPKVTSALVRLEPKQDAARVPAAAIAAVTAAAFGQRRKMLRSSLKAVWMDPTPALAHADLSPTVRAEDAPVVKYVALAEFLAAKG